MNIVWLMFQNDPTCFDDVSVEEKLVLDGIWDYVEGRLMPLKDEIEKEEAPDGEELKKGVIIGFPTKGIGCQGYSKPLQEKILSCFSQDDITALYILINEKLEALNN